MDPDAILADCTVDTTSTSDGDNVLVVSATLPAIPLCLIPHCTGKLGENVEAIGKLTSTMIDFPPALADKTTARGFVRISGSSTKAVAASRLHFDKVLAEARAKVGYTHFLSLPLCLEPASSPSAIAHPFARFFSNLQQLNPAGFEPSCMMQSGKLHVTVFMLRLLTQDEIDLARETLRRAAAPIEAALRRAPLVLQIKGLDVMEPSLDKANIMFGKVADVGEGTQSTSSGTTTAESRLTKLVHALATAFKEAGLLSDHELSKQRLFDGAGGCGVKWHCTLVNSKYRGRSVPIVQGLEIFKSSETKDSSTGESDPLVTSIPDDAGSTTELLTVDGVLPDNNTTGAASDGNASSALSKPMEKKKRGPFNGPRHPFNAKPIMEALGDFDFGTHRIPALHISRMAVPGLRTPAPAVDAADVDRWFYHCDGHIELP